MRTLSNPYKALLLGGALSIAPFLAFAQPQSATPLVDTNKNVICAFNGASDDDMGEVLGSPSPEALKAVQWIVDQIGTHNDFIVSSATFKRSPLAYVVLSQDGKSRHIVYDVDEFVADQGVLSYSDIAILAHEIAHHINSDTSISGRSSHMQELRADRLSGVMVNRLGGTLEDALAHVHHFSKTGSASHPVRKKRIEAITDGWHHAEKMRFSESGRCRPRWLGTPFNVEDNVCRIALSCSSSGKTVKTACSEPASNKWSWKD